MNDLLADLKNGICLAQGHSPAILTHPLPQLDELLQRAYDEIDHWREDQALVLKRMIKDHDTLLDAGDQEGAAKVRLELKDVTISLNWALEGKTAHICAPCGKPVREGHVVYRYDDVGEVHAECAGATPEQIAAMEMPADPANYDPEEHPNGIPSVVKLSVWEPLFTADQIAEIAAQGRKICGMDEDAGTAGPA